MDALEKLPMAMPARGAAMPQNGVPQNGGAFSAALDDALAQAGAAVAGASAEAAVSSALPGTAPALAAPALPAPGKTPAPSPAPLPDSPLTAGQPVVTEGQAAPPSEAPPLLPQPSLAEPATAAPAPPGEHLAEAEREEETDAATLAPATTAEFLPAPAPPLPAPAPAEPARPVQRNPEPMADAASPADAPAPRAAPAPAAPPAAPSGHPAPAGQVTPKPSAAPSSAPMEAGSDEAQPRREGPVAQPAARTGPTAEWQEPSSLSRPADERPRAELARPTDAEIQPTASTEGPLPVAAHRDGGSPETVTAAAPASLPGVTPATPLPGSPVASAPPPEAPAPARFVPRTAPAEQVAPVAIALALGGGAEGRIALSLDPVELGRVEVVVERVGEAAHVQVAAERPETLALLARDAGALDRALGGAGIGAEGGRSLSFSLLGGDAGAAGGGSFGAPGGEGGRNRGGQGGGGWRGGDGPIVPDDAGPRRQSLLGLLDIAI
ncbi:hook-length control protein FliK [Roseomonas rosea]|uniref:Hook-length control protein FliK n=1 Tax=Muricoccus roseus TaxID=198092 RepID=A0A1M6QYC0_9PROT|nr:flagellar hook-length control protein FliK [Roseomonas rosea]SHK25067.1 hook-length control protein FliK [Roseomonas rosea]